MKLLFVKYNPMRDESRPIEVGIEPLIRLLFNTRYCRLLSRPIEDGKVPVMAKSFEKLI